MCFHFLRSLQGGHLWFNKWVPYRPSCDVRQFICSHRSTRDLLSAPNMSRLSHRHASSMSFIALIMSTEDFVYCCFSKMSACKFKLSSMNQKLLFRVEPALLCIKNYNSQHNRRTSEHTTPLLRELHWLRVPRRIQFRLCVLAYHCVHGTAPAYLTESLRLTSEIVARRRLRSVDSPTLLVPSTRRSTLGDRAFPVAEQSAATDHRDASLILIFRRETIFSVSHLADRNLAPFPADW